MRALRALTLCTLAACAQPIPEGPEPVRLVFPEMRSFAASSPGPPRRSNAEIARDFLDLSFRMESGRPLPVLTRFEGPITVRLTGQAAATLERDLRDLLSRLRREAKIDIQITQAPTANIIIESLPNSRLQRVAPNAACFVVPRVGNWSELRRARGSSRLDWATLETRERVAIFLPNDVAPQEMRDCLHEELAQALGPLNDLYRLPDSVFNDDNIHAVLTGFDMLILRAYYAPELASGMTVAEVADRIPGILARLNPAGRSASGPFDSPTTRAFIDTIEEALSERSSEPNRRRAALRAVDIVDQLGWSGPREGFANYVYGRLQLGNDTSAALGAFNTANAAYRARQITDLHRAHVALQLAAYSLVSRDPDTTIALTDEAIPVVRRHQNAALLSLLMMFKAEALDMKGQADAGMALRLDSLGWARYGFGSRAEVIDRLNEIAALAQDRTPS